MCKVIYSFSLKHLYTHKHFTYQFSCIFFMYRRQNVEEKLRNEGVQPVKLRQESEMTTETTTTMPHVARVYGEPPEYELVEPSFRYLAHVEANFLHLRQAEAKKQFCNRFLKAREIELR